MPQVGGEAPGRITTAYMTTFFRFPHTPHLHWLGQGTPRDDKVMTAAEASRFLSRPVVVEEKVDGANLGFSLSEDGELLVQNRGQYLTKPCSGQFARLGTWLAQHGDALFDALAPGLVAFGEWVAARHSLDYTALPDWWLLFDIYDLHEDRFWSTRRRDVWAAGAGVSVVPAIGQGRTTLAELTHALQGRSRFRDGPMEGVIARCEDSSWLHERGKLVRAEFTQHIDEHWRNRPMEWNRLQTPP